ncbi:MAG: hypothetical protein QM784_15410 [Polyangiaceae bacterium]
MSGRSPVIFLVAATALLRPSAASAQSAATSRSTVESAATHDSADVTPAKTRVTGADSSEGAATSGTSARAIDLTAGHVEIEGPFNRLSLSRGVKLTVHRYRVTADHLTLDRTPRGLQVDGSGSVAFCPCTTPPLTVGFSSALVAPPTDLILRNATFRAYGVPVFWLPVFWVRSPNRFGLLSPRLSYRGHDGLFVGSGFHLPLSKNVEPSPEFVDVYFGNYMLSGMDVGAQLVTVNTVTNVRWDYLDKSLVELDFRGHRALGNFSSAAWRVDTIRGPRARTGYVSFDAANRAYDHNRVEAVVSDGETLVSIGLHESALRGTGLRRLGMWGPSARIGVGTALGDVGHVDSALTSLGIIASDSDPSAVTLHTSTLRFDMRPGPFAVKSAMHERWLLATGPNQELSGGTIGTEAQLSLPLVREWGDSPSPWTHWLEPHLLATAAARHSGESATASVEGITTAQFGVSTWFGRPRSTSALHVLLRGGVVRTGSDVREVTAARLSSGGEWLGLGGSAASESPWNDRDRAWLSVLRGRLGRIDRIALSTRLEGRSLREPLAARWLLDEGFSPWLSRWYSVPGWTLGNEVDVGLFDQLAATAGATIDLQSESVIAQRIGAAYRHPCGCLAASTIAGWRVGRPGWDVTLLLDLMP